MKILTLALVATGLAAMMYKTSARREAKPLAARAGSRPNRSPAHTTDTAEGSATGAESEGAR